MFRIRSTRSSTSWSHNLVNSAKLNSNIQSDCSIFRNIRSRRVDFGLLLALYCGEDIQKYLAGLRSCVDCLLGSLTTNNCIDQ
jgi:hypothetical protein